MNRYRIRALRGLCLTTLCLHTSITLAASSFNELYDVVFGPPPAPVTPIEAEEQAMYASGQLPQYAVRVSNFIMDGINYLRQDAIRTVNETADYYPRVEKRVHSNGICFTGTWRISADTPYSGYFKQGATGLIMARASTALSETRRGQSRGFGFAGKIFPTLDPDMTTDSANFFLVDVLMGAQRDRYLDVGMTNKPATGFRFSVLYLGLVAASAFARADSNPGFRPLYPIAELGLAAGDTATTPTYMMLRGSAENVRNDQIDFRDELNLELNGNEELRFDILVSDVSARQSSSSWQTIGEVVLNESVVSYGCDRMLHFPHPKMK